MWTTRRATIGCAFQPAALGAMFAVPFGAPPAGQNLLVIPAGADEPARPGTEFSAAVTAGRGTSPCVPAIAAGSPTAALGIISRNDCLVAFFQHEGCGAAAASAVPAVSAELAQRSS